MGWVQLTSNRVDLGAFQDGKLDPGLFSRIQHGFDRQAPDREAVGLSAVLKMERAWGLPALTTIVEGMKMFLSPTTALIS